MAEYDPAAQRMVFQSCMAKYRANYGEDRFPVEKCDLIWQELKEFSPKQIANVCAVIMAESRFAPTLVEFRERAGMLREKIRQWEREQERRDAADFWEGTFHSSEVKMIVATIRDRIAGKCPDDVWADFQAGLKRAAQISESNQTHKNNTCN